MIIIKLGGSVITNKKKLCTFKRDITIRLVREIKKSNKQVIIVHGAGSFGHILAKEFNLKEGFKKKNQINAVAKVQRDVKNLNLKILNILIENGINAISIPASSTVFFNNKKIEMMNTKIFEVYLKLGFTPVIFGDVVLDSKIGFTICSGDDLMVELSKGLKPKKAIFVTDEDGIYSSNPKINKKAVLLKKIDSKNYTKINFETNVDDVTGGMDGKIKTALEISNLGIECYIINGNIKNRLKNSLIGKKIICTKIC